MSCSFSLLQAPAETGARGGVISEVTLRLADFFLLLRLGRAGDVLADDFGREKDAEGSVMVAKLLKFVVEFAIWNAGFLVENASPRPPEDGSQDDQPGFMLGGGLGEDLLLEIFIAEVGRIGGPHGQAQWMELVAECLGVECVINGGKADG